MPDIFGRRLTDYAHLAALESWRPGLGMQRVRRQAEQWGIPPHDFNVQPNRRGAFYEADIVAQSLGYVRNNMSAIMNTVQSVLYARHKMPDIIAIDTSVSEDARFYGGTIVDEVGRAGFMNPDGTNVETATISSRPYAEPIYPGGIIASWSIDELRAARFAGVPLPDRTLRAAVRACQDHMDRVTIQGDTTRNLQGIRSLTGVTVASAGATFASMTPDNLLTWLQNRAEEVYTNTNGVFGEVITNGLTFYMPTSRASICLHRRLTDGVTTSVWGFFQRFNLWRTETGEEIRLVLLDQLLTAGAGNTARMFVGFRNADVMKIVMPFAPRALAPQQDLYRIVIPMEYKLSGVDVMHPTALRYYDGV